MTTGKTSIPLTFSERLVLAETTQEAAWSAYLDERLVSAASLYHLAAKLWASMDHGVRATRCYHQAKAIESEMIARAQGDTDEAEYIEQQIRAGV